MSKKFIVSTKEVIERTYVVECDCIDYAPDLLGGGEFEELVSEYLSNYEIIGVEELQKNKEE